MKRLLKTVVLSGIALIAVGTSAFADTFVRCPLDLARRTITNSLPSGWWTTPIVNRLSGTRVQNIGGQPALMCIYGVSGSIQRRQPAGHVCRAASGGFRCNRVGGGLPRPQTFSTALLNVPQTYTFDLDRGGIRAGGRSDMWFEAQTATRFFLTSRNGARFSVSGRRNRGYHGCRSAVYRTGRIPLTPGLVGTYICVRTNEGRISEFRVNSLSSGYPKTLRIGYTTWR